MVRQATEMSESGPPRRLQRRYLQAGGDHKRVNARIAGISAGSLLGLFFASLLLPVEPEIAGLRLTPYNLLQIVFFVPLLFRLKNDPTNRIVALDLFMVLYVLWIGLSIYDNHGISRIVYIGNQTLTLLGSYLIGRVLIRSAEDYRLFFVYFFYSLAIMLPFAVIELFTRQMLLSNVLSKVVAVHSQAGQPPRLGLNRVQAFAEHSILFGLFCSIGVANLFYIHREEIVKRLSRTGLAAFMTFISLSSAPNIAMGLQVVLIAWDRTMRIFAFRWYVLAVGSAVLLGFAELALENGILGFVIENFAFDPTTGWGRMEVFEYGSAEVLRNPVFGIGLGDWVRPWWRKPSVDNFWLATALRFGLPALLILVVALGVHFVRIMVRGDVTETVANYRRGYLVAWAGLAFVLGSVNIWGSVGAMVMTYIGAGAWFYTSEPRVPEAPARSERPAATRVASPRDALRRQAASRSSPESSPKSSPESSPPATTGRLRP